MAATTLSTMILTAVQTTDPMAVPHTISAASIGIPDTFFLMLLALIVFGPRRLPEIGRQIGKLMYEFRKVSNDFKFQMEEELRASEEAERVRKLEAVKTAQPAIDVAALQAPVEAEPRPFEIASGSETVAAEANIGEDSAPAVEGEVRGSEVHEEAQQFPAIQPPATGETIAAQKPFRNRVPDPAEEPGDTVLKDAAHQHVVADEGRVGTEVQPGLEPAPRVEAAGAEQAVHHG